MNQAKIRYEKVKEKKEETQSNLTKEEILSLILYPFSLKIFFAPIEYYYFISKFGKRKTYIVPI